jgi:putative nucleotidyltransferase with HDIG domain
VQRETEATRNVAAVLVPYKAGDVVYRAGDRLSERQRLLALAERSAYESSLGVSSRMVRAGGVFGLVAMVALAVAGYCRFFYGEHFVRWWQGGRLALVSAAMLWASCWGAVSVPGLFWLLALAPTVLLALMVLVAYDRRVALLVAGAQALLVSATLGLGVGFVAVSLVGSMVANWRLSEIRTRTDMVLGGLAMTAILAIRVAVVSLVDRPMWPGVVDEIARDGLAAGMGGFIATAVAMVLLPGIERVFGVTTGMTLSELRDPKHPLLRELQQRAPGTYNHSLNVASLAEAGANAIGANGLHLYVGALYHDVGKMNKPEYFVENQIRGFNKHDKLSPAMSLLVIVGHVKDGVELARAYRLPKSLIHYIESHHGTTLVEYFYDQAKRQAVEAESDKPTEIEYRYPGPRPRTKEAAILMLCDAVESATRAMPDPTPGRIQALVRSLARKRLVDGQFDECGLTLRELSQVEDAVAKSLAAVYHGRLAYPKAEPAPEEIDEMVSRADRVAAEQGA